MSEADETSPSTEGMVDYDANSRAQKEHALGNADVIADLAQRVANRPDDLNITDYGCGPGQSAIETVRPALDAWSSLVPRKNVSVCHADQPGNDWNALMSLVAGKSGYLNRPHPPLVSAAVGSFYERMVPDRSVSVGTCFFASHWLRSTASFDAPDTVWFADLTGNARHEMWRRAKEDWVRFLRLRAEELQPGGFLFVSTIGAVPEAGEINDTAASGRGIYRAMQAITKSMTEDGLLARDVTDNFVFGLWFLTAQEAREAFEEKSGLADLYDVDTIDVIGVDGGGDVFSSYLDDPLEYASKYVGYTKAFAASSLRAGLFEPTLGKGKDTTQLEAEFFRRFEELYREKTTAYALEQWHLKVILRRKDS
ncbi:MAG: hypothetical protein RDA78_26305 [Roseibium sp.]|uniref:hypothetical protein n=1 Tax=Roseibium sp. TaxID=1936156 RepID=UPI003D9C653F